MYLLNIKNILCVTQKTLEEARATLQTPPAPPSPLATAYSLAGIDQAANAFHEKVLSRMSHLDNKMHEAMGPRVKEYENVLEQNRRLLGELDGLREKVGLIGYQKHFYTAYPPICSSKDPLVTMSASRRCPCHN